MKENHSYDICFGRVDRGDGFALDANGQPLNSNPDARGRPVRAHHLRVPFNPTLHLSQTCDASHRQWDGGAIDGFVTPTGSTDPMGYFDGSDLPWYYACPRSLVDPSAKAVASTHPMRPVLPMNGTHELPAEVEALRSRHSVRRGHATERGGYRFNQRPHARYRGGDAWQILRDLGVRRLGHPPGGVPQNNPLSDADIANWRTLAC